MSKSKKVVSVGTIDLNQLYQSVRRTWGNVKPGTKIEKSKKTYNRKDKSWKCNID